jgi:hypothetical protein
MIQDDNSYPRFWRCKRLGRKCVHNVKRFACAIARNRLLALVVPWITGSYYLVLDVWGDRWTFISDNIEIHEKLFCISLLLSLVTLFIRGLLKNSPGRFEADGDARKVMSDFINGYIRVSQTHDYHLRAIKSGF